jgi:ribonucleotide monophosphatase NagD (HAD superfamily)
MALLAELSERDATGDLARIYQEMLIKKRPDLTPRDILMVGDTLETDIRGANAFGIDTALVLTGNTQPDAVEIAIRSSGIIPDFVCVSVLT